MSPRSLPPLMLDHRAASALGRTDAAAFAPAEAAVHGVPTPHLRPPLDPIPGAGAWHAMVLIAADVAREDPFGAARSALLRRAASA